MGLGLVVLRRLRVQELLVSSHRAEGLGCSARVEATTAFQDLPCRPCLLSSKLGRSPGCKQATSYKVKKFFASLFG